MKGEREKENDSEQERGEVITTERRRRKRWIYVKGSPPRS